MPIVAKPSRLWDRARQVFRMDPSPRESRTFIDQKLVPTFDAWDQEKVLSAIEPAAVNVSAAGVVSVAGPPLGKCWDILAGYLYVASGTLTFTQLALYDAVTPVYFDIFAAATERTWQPQFPMPLWARKLGQRDTIAIFVNSVTVAGTVRARLWLKECDTYA